MEIKDNQIVYIDHHVSKYASPQEQSHQIRILSFPQFRFKVLDNVCIEANLDCFPARHLISLDKLAVQSFLILNPVNDNEMLVSLNTSLIKTEDDLTRLRTHLYKNIDFTKAIANLDELVDLFKSEINNYIDFYNLVNIETKKINKKYSTNLSLIGTVSFTTQSNLIEQNRILLNKSALDSLNVRQFSPATFVCPICCEEVDSIESIGLNRCGHQACSNCWRQYLNAAPTWKRIKTAIICDAYAVLSSAGIARPITHPCTPARPRPKRSIMILKTFCH